MFVFTGAPTAPTQTERQRDPRSQEPEEPNHTTEVNESTLVEAEKQRQVHRTKGHTRMPSSPTRRRPSTQNDVLRSASQTPSDTAQRTMTVTPQQQNHSPPNSSTQSTRSYSSPPGPSQDPKEKGAQVFSSQEEPISVPPRRLSSALQARLGTPSTDLSTAPLQTHEDEVLEAATPAGRRHGLEENTISATPTNVSHTRWNSNAPPSPIRQDKTKRLADRALGDPRYRLRKPDNSPRTAVSLGQQVEGHIQPRSSHQPHTLPDSSPASSNSQQNTPNSTLPLIDLDIWKSYNREGGSKTYALKPFKSLTSIDDQTDRVDVIRAIQRDIGVRPKIIDACPDKDLRDRWKDEDPRNFSTEFLMRIRHCLVRTQRKREGKRYQDGLNDKAAAEHMVLERGFRDAQRALHDAEKMARKAKIKVAAANEESKAAEEVVERREEELREAKARLDEFEREE